LTPCRIPVPTNALVGTSLAAPRHHACAAADALDQRFSSAPAIRSPSPAMAISSQSTLMRVSSSPSPANMLPGSDSESRLELPALLVEHVGTDCAAAATVPGLYDRLQRDCSILSGVAAIITLFDLHGRVLHQNALSVDYMGYHRPPPQWRNGAAAATATANDAHRRCHGRASTLERLFEFDPTKLPEMLSDVMDGRPWTGIVRVPAFLWDELDELDEQLPQHHWTERQRRQQGPPLDGEVDGDTAAVSSLAMGYEMDEQQGEEEEGVGEERIEVEDSSAGQGGGNSNPRSSSLPLPLPLPHGVEQLCFEAEAGVGGMNAIASTSTGARRPVQIIRGGSSGSGKARLARVGYGNFTFGDPQSLARLMVVGSEMESYGSAASAAATPAAAVGARGSRSGADGGLPNDEPCSSDNGQPERNPVQGPLAGPLTSSINGRRVRQLRSRFGSGGTQLYGSSSVVDSASGPEISVIAAVSHGGDDAPPSDGQQTVPSLSPSVTSVTAAATTAVAADVDEVIAVSRSAASATAGMLPTRRSHQAHGLAAGLRSRVTTRISFNGGPFPSLYGSVDRTCGGRRVPGRSPSGNVVLDLQAINTSSWSLVGAWPNMVSPARRRASVTSGAPLPPPAPPLTQQRHLSGQLTRLSQPLPITPSSARGSAGWLTQPHNPNQQQQQQPPALRLSEQLLELAELQPVRAASISAGGRRRSTASGSTPLPRVVFFAAASVQRVSARQQKKQQRPTRSPQGPRGGESTAAFGTFTKSASMPQPGLRPRLPVLSRGKDPNQATQPLCGRRLGKTSSPFSNASCTPAAVTPLNSTVPTTSNESVGRGHEGGGDVAASSVGVGVGVGVGGDGSGAGSSSERAGGSGANVG
ncbi:hypothetical protein Vretifemale_5510, partial [Volvox reticuliferus]